MLFNRYFLQSFRLGEITLYAPTSREEYKQGYDGRFTGTSSFREVYLQFKRPQWHSGGTFSIKTTPHQHANLLKRPAGSAFYVAHTFLNMSELGEAQQGAGCAKDFLRYFVLIDVTALRPDTERIYYGRNAHNCYPSAVSHGWTKRQLSRKSGRRVPSTHWYRGTVFRDRFASHEVGVDVLLPTIRGCNSQVSPSIPFLLRPNCRVDVPMPVTIHDMVCSNVWAPSDDDIARMSSVGTQQGGASGSFGCMLRTEQVGAYNSRELPERACR
jgi:hypothetical protein